MGILFDVIDIHIIRCIIFFIFVNLKDYNIRFLKYGDICILMNIINHYYGAIYECPYWQYVGLLMKWC
jgi:hypothetical protein